MIQEAGQSQGLCFGKLDEHFVCHESVQTLKKELLACVTCNLTNEMVLRERQSRCSVSITSRNVKN